MSTRIAFAGGEAIDVEEELAAVVEALEGHAPDTPALPRFTRTDDGRPVHIRPAAILHVSPT